MTKHQEPHSAVPATAYADRAVLDKIAEALTDLRFGSVEITVHDGKVTQIECKRKIRLS